jgi:hypothetical protein
MKTQAHVLPFLSLVALTSLTAACGKITLGPGDAGSTSTTSSTVSSASTTSTSSGATASAAPSASADPDACPAGTKPFTPTFSDVAFTWSETPSLDAAPKDGVYFNVGAGQKTMKADKVELWVTKSRKDFSLRFEANGSFFLGGSLSFKSLPQAGTTLNDKFGTNSGYFQVPYKRAWAECSKQTISYNGSNARILKITKYDEAKETADGVFVTTWRESFDQKREFWAAGTFTNAKVVVFK